MKIMDVDEIRMRFKNAGSKNDKKIIIEDTLETLRYRLREYYSGQYFKRISTEYLKRLYGANFGSVEVFRRNLPKIEFAFSTLNRQNLIEVIARHKKPKITTRWKFFDTINDFFSYCTNVVPFAIFVGAIYVEDIEGKKVPRFRPLSFDFDYNNWKEVVPWALVMSFMMSFIFDVHEFMAFFSGRAGIHLYPLTKTELIRACERNKVIREAFSDSIAMPYTYFNVMPKMFLVIDKILKKKKEIIETLFFDNNACGIEYELLISDDELNKVMNDPTVLIGGNKPTKKFLSKFFPPISNPRMYDKVVTKDIKRIIRLPPSMHATTFETVKPFLVNGERVFEIKTR